MIRWLVSAWLDTVPFPSKTKSKVKSSGQECPLHTIKVNGDGEECPSDTVKIPTSRKGREKWGTRLLGLKPDCIV